MSGEVVLFADLYFDGGTNVKRVCTGKSWYSASGDSVGVLEWDGRIVEEPTYSIELGCSIWANESSISIGDLILDNEDGSLLDWLSFQARDCICVLRLGFRDGAYADQVVAHTCLMEECYLISDRKIAITLQALDTRLDRAIQDQVYESSPEATNDGKPKPVLFGKVYQAEPVLYDSNGPDYKCGDIYLTVDAVYSGGSLAIPPGFGQQWIYDADHIGFEMQIQPSARITSHLSLDASVQADEISGSGEFFDDSNWTGNNPNGWTVTDTPTANDVTHREGIGLQMVSNGAAHVSLFHNAGLPSGKTTWYIATLRVAEVVSGSVVVIIGATTVMSVERAGEYTAVFSSNSPFLYVRIPAGQTANVTVSAFYIHKLESDSESDSLAEYVTQAAMRGGFAFAELDKASWPAAMDVEVGSFHKDQSSCRSVISQALKAMTGFFWIGPDGEFLCGRLEEGSGTPDIVLSRLNLTALPIYRADKAEGLSDSWAGARNWSPYAESELAGITYPNRPPFMAEYRHTTKGTGLLARDYRHAVGAPPIGTFLYSESDTQAEADRITGIMSERHGFWDVSVAFVDAIEAASMAVNGVAKLDDTKYFGDNFDGTLGRIVKVTGRFRQNEIEMTVWVNSEGA